MAAMRDRPAVAAAVGATAARGRRPGRRVFAIAALALLPGLVGCGTAVGSALYSTPEAIAAAVKDAIGEREGSSAEEDRESTGRADR